MEVIMSPVPCESNKKNKDSEYNFLKICSYLNLVTIQRIIVKQINNSQVDKTLKFDKILKQIPWTLRESRPFCQP